MTKRTLLLFSVLFCFFIPFSFGQSFSFPGTRMGNYTGVQSVFFNPAQAADSKYKFDLNLFGISGGFGNNKASYSLNAVVSSFNPDNSVNSLFSGDGRLSGQANLDILGPSLLISLPKKSGIMISTRMRGQFSITDIDGKLAKTVLDDLNNQITFPYTLSSGNNMRINTTGWAEYGITYSRVIKEQGNHFLKAGATIKYLAGAGNNYIQLDQMSGTLIQNPVDPNSPVYLSTGSRGTIGVGISGNNVSFSPTGILNSTSSGIGADLGFVYEFRDGSSKRHPYKYRLSLSVLDLGSIKFDRDLTNSGTFNMLVTAVPGFNLETLQGISFDGYKQFFSSNPNFTASPNNIDPTLNISLPTSLQLYGDVHLVKNFYLSAGTQIALSNRSKPQNPFVYSGFTVTPRFEGRVIGLYAPINYNSLTQLTMGASLRLGPLFIGSGSILSALFSKSKQADIQAGLHLGILKRVKKKTDESEAENKPSN